VRSRCRLIVFKRANKNRPKKRDAVELGNLYKFTLRIALLSMPKPLTPAKGYPKNP